MCIIFNVDVSVTEDTRAKSFLIIVQIVQGFFYARLKPVSLNFAVPKMYHIKPYPCTVRGGMPQALFAHLFAS